MRRLAENFIFRKVKRLRKTESGRSVSLEEEWREEVQLIRQEGDDDHFAQSTPSVPPKKNSKGWTPPPTPPKPGKDKRPSLVPSIDHENFNGSEKVIQIQHDTEKRDVINGSHDPWTSFYEDGSDTASTVKYNPNLNDESLKGNNNLDFLSESKPSKHLAFEDNFEHKTTTQASPVKDLPEVNVTESFAIHRYFDAEYLTHSIKSGETALVASQMEESEENSLSVGLTPKVTRKARECLLSRNQLLAETPTNSISERIANEEVAEVLKDCSSVVGADAAMVTPEPERKQKESKHAQQQTTSPRIAELPQKLTYKGQPINVHISGPIHFLTVAGQKSSENGVLEYTRASPQLEKYAETICDFNQVFADLNKIILDQSQQQKVKNLKEDLRKATSGLNFSYQVGPPRHQPTPKPTPKVYQRPASIPPYLVQTSSYCHSAKITDITQEWRLERESDFGEIVGVVCPRSTAPFWGMEDGNMETKRRLSPTPPRMAHKLLGEESKRMRKSPVWGDAPYVQHDNKIEERVQDQRQNKEMRRNSEYDMNKSLNGYDNANPLLPGRFPIDIHSSMPSRSVKESSLPGTRSMALHKTRSEDVHHYKQHFINAEQYATLKQTIWQVERDLDSAQKYTKEARSDQAKQIEQAIWAISEKISEEKAAKWMPSEDGNKVIWTKAQAEANEELLRTRLAEMILNLDDDEIATELEKRPLRADEYNFSQLQEPIDILRNKLHCLEQFFEEEDSLQEELKSIHHLPLPTRLTPNIMAKERSLQQRQDGIARMTPLIVVVRNKLNNLEDMAVSEASQASGRQTPYQDRRTVHDLLVSINTEINTIHDLCRERPGLEGINAVVEVLSKVCSHLDVILETLRAIGIQQKGSTQTGKSEKQEALKIPQSAEPRKGINLEEAIKRKEDIQSIGRANDKMHSNGYDMPGLRNIGQQMPSNLSKIGKREEKSKTPGVQKIDNRLPQNNDSEQNLKASQHIIETAPKDVPKKPLPRRLLEESADTLSVHNQANASKPPLSPRSITPTYGSRLLPHQSPKNNDSFGQRKSKTINSLASQSLANIDIVVELAKRGDHQKVAASMPLGVLNMQMSQYIFDELEEERSMQMVCEESDDTTQTASPFKGTAKSFHHHLGLPTAQRQAGSSGEEAGSEMGTASLVESTEHSPIPFSHIGYQIGGVQEPMPDKKESTQETGTHGTYMMKNGAKQESKSTGFGENIDVVHDVNKVTSSQNQTSEALYTPVLMDIPHHNRLQVPFEGDEDECSASVSFAENIPILFRKVSEDYSLHRETAILSDEDDTNSKSVSTLQVYNLNSSCSETFELRRRRRHALLNAVVIPEIKAQISATFLGDSFQIEVERMSETGRDSVVMVSEEFYTKRIKITRGIAQEAEKSQAGAGNRKGVSSQSEQGPVSSNLTSRVAVPTIIEEDEGESLKGQAACQKRSSGSPSDEDDSTSIFVDTLAKLNVSIMARSAKDNVFVNLEEIPWGEVEIHTKAAGDDGNQGGLPAAGMDLSFTNASVCSTTGSQSVQVPFNIHVTENQDEARSVASVSHRSAGAGSQSVNQARFDGSEKSLDIVDQTQLISQGEDVDIATYVIKQGSTASITCELNSYVDRREPIEWYRNGKEKVGPSSAKFERISHDLLEILVIHDVGMNDGQLYSIKVNGQMYPVAYLIIEDKLEDTQNGEESRFLSKSPQTMFVMQGQTAIMSCQMNKAGLDVEWYKEQEKMVPGTDDRVFYESTAKGWYRVIVEDVDFADQGTYYACLEDKSICITLVVEEKIDEREVQVSSAETDDEELSDYLVPTGSTATIACELDMSAAQLSNNQTSGSQVLHWQRNGRDVDTSAHGGGKFEHVISSNKHYLIIHNAQPNDSGVYSVRINDTRFKVAQITISDGLLRRQLSGSRIKRISNSSLNVQ
ncbi:titin [Ditylenchus destructor]|nr:titin [Ditylenchus destructor]